MTTRVECERERMARMSAQDGEAPSTGGSGHFATCESCREWLTRMEVLDARLGMLAYPPARVDLWSPIAARIAEGERRAVNVRQLWPVGAALFGWRALQLLVDLPAPWLQPIVLVAAAVLVAWRLGGDLLAIELTAPELQKRGL